jgi:hypothetical protein
MMPLAMVALIPFTGGPQIVMLALIRLSRSRLLRSVFLLASIAMLALFGRFLATADLTSTSTAPLAAIFYPLYRAAGAAVIGGVLLFVERKG